MSMSLWARSICALVCWEEYSRAGVLGKDDGVYALLLAQNTDLFFQLFPQEKEVHALHAEKKAILMPSFSKM